MSSASHHQHWVKKTPKMSAPNNVSAEQKEEKKSAPLEVPLICPSPIVDIGANLNNREFAHDVNDVLDRAHKANVTKMMITGTTIKNSIEGIEIAEQYSTSSFPIFATAGIHPHDSKHFNDKTISEIEALIKKHPCIKAIGETGLDFNRNFSPQDVQLHSFEEHVKLAVKLQMPMFLHERDAHKELMSILEKYDDKLKGLICVHCFTGSKEELEAYVKKGYYVGVTTFLAKRKRGEELRSFIADVLPLEQLLIETDCPYMAPDDKRCKRYMSRNEPCTLPILVETLAKCYGKSEEEIAKATTENANKFFRFESNSTSSSSSQ